VYEPFTIGSRLRVVPPGLTRAADGRIDLVIARGAFGSGEHETTASCLERLEQLDELRGARVLDLGSGTAILAVAALKLGARRAVCVDPDPRAASAGRLSCELNGVAHLVEHVPGTLSDVAEDGFDLALANLYGDLLLGCGADLLGRVRPGGLLLLSGMLWEQAYDVRCRFAELGAWVEHERWLEEFVTMQLRRPEVG